MFTSKHRSVRYFKDHDGEELEWVMPTSYMRLGIVCGMVMALISGAMGYIIIKRMKKVI